MHTKPASPLQLADDACGTSWGPSPAGVTKLCCDETLVRPDQARRNQLAWNATSWDGSGFPSSFPASLLLKFCDDLPTDKAQFDLNIAMNDKTFVRL